MSHTLDEQSTRLYRIRKTVMEMLRDRDYVVAEFELSFTQEQFREKFGDEPKREDLTIQKPSRSNNAEHIFVFFPEEAKVGVKTIKTYVDRMKTETVHRAILVVQQNLTPFARQCVSEMSSKYHLEVFQEAELLVNIKDHVLVPEHEVMTPDETQTLLERYTDKETQGNLPVAPLTRARAVNTGNSKKRKIVHRTSSGRRKDAETKTVPLRKMKAAASLDLSDPSQLTMKEIIRRAEAIERAKAREEAAKKAEEKEKRGASSTTSAAATESPVAQDTPAPSVLTPQVQIVNGRIVINQQSLVVAAQASTREDTDSYRRVEEDRPKLNYNSYANRTPVERWKAEDTDLFYKALQQFGTDFELIQNLFPGRTRRQVKAKFKNEEKLNPVRLADALGHKTQDQSHHYRAIIEMLKTEKPDGENEDDILLERLLLPSVMDGSVTTQQTPGTQASSSTDKVDEVVNLEAPANAVVLEKTKPDLRMASASEPMVSIPPESEVATDTGNDDPLASEATGNPLSSYQSNSNSSANPLGSYGKQTNPLGRYGKESLSGNPLGSYAKNPLGVYK